MLTDGDDDLGLGPIRRRPSFEVVVRRFTALRAVSELRLLPVLEGCPKRERADRFVSALYPKADSPSDGGRGDVDDGSMLPRLGAGIGGLERVVLSIGLSIAITPLIGLVLNFTPVGIRLAPVIASLSGFILLTTVVAALRRWDLPADERFSVPYRSWFARGRRKLFRPQSRTDAVLNVVVVVSLLFAVTSVGWAATVPKQGEAFTELSLLTERNDGDLVADEYPAEFVRGESEPLVVGIGNHEHERMQYTVVVKLQRVSSGNDGTRVVAERELRRFAATVDAGDSWREKQFIHPTMSGQRLRLVYLLYKGEPAADPSIENAARETHLWINVTESEPTGNVAARSAG